MLRVIKNAKGRLRMTGLSDQEWKSAWENGAIPWHQNKVNPVFEQYIISKNASHKKPTCFFPLCGKSVDMFWAAKHGCLVRGSEFSQVAIDEFFNENNIISGLDNGFTRSEADLLDIRIRPGDFYEYPEEEKFELIFDRGSMVAIDPADRIKYAEKIAKLLDKDGTVLLEAVQRDEGNIECGPPYHLTFEQVKETYNPLGLKVTELETNRARKGEFTTLYFQISN